jgi:general secretion pathway protein K
MLSRLNQRLRRTDRNDGFIIVAVLWILAALATLASIIAVYVINAATAFTVHDERVQAEALTRASIELSLYNIVRNAEAPPTRGSFAFRMGTANVAAEFNSEMARIDLNGAPKALLAGLFAGLGAPGQAADSYADRIIGWRSTPAPDAPDESALYRSAGLPYSPRGAPFQHVAELGLVMGIPEVLLERAMPYFTVYSGQSQINIMDAAPQVLAALPGMSPGLLNEILVRRAQRDQQTAEQLLALLGPTQQLGTISGSKAIRVSSRIVFDSGQRVTSEVVVFILDGGGDVYRIMTWRDDVDDAPADQRNRIVTR